ncbi:hypothetical protein JB92DRAFT_1154412 [Gautieria morchelliformis]|nr:hypothetical protein JB92DRAFT_1154412 [Gautieria morchelliformis]
MPVVGRDWLWEDSEEEVIDLRTPFPIIMRRAGLLSPHSKLLRRRVMSPSDAGPGATSDDARDERAARDPPGDTLRRGPCGRFLGCPNRPRRRLRPRFFRGAACPRFCCFSQCSRARWPSDVTRVDCTLLHVPRCPAPTGENDVLSRSRASLIRVLCHLLLEA